jgi:hypothetical protein
MKGLTPREEDERWEIVIAAKRPAVAKAMAGKPQRAQKGMRKTERRDGSFLLGPCDLL